MMSIQNAVVAPLRPGASLANLLATRSTKRQSMRSFRFDALAMTPEADAIRHQVFVRSSRTSARTAATPPTVVRGPPSTRRSAAARALPGSSG